MLLEVCWRIMAALLYFRHIMSRLPHAKHVPFFKCHPSNLFVCCNKSANTYTAWTHLRVILLKWMNRMLRKWTNRAAHLEIPHTTSGYVTYVSIRQHNIGPMWLVRFRFTWVLYSPREYLFNLENTYRLRMKGKPYEYFSAWDRLSINPSGIRRGWIPFQHIYILKNVDTFRCP